jgi:hypothetical protein
MSRLVELSVLYGLVGAGLTALLVTRGQIGARSVDAALVLVLWPLVAPFAMAPAAGRRGASRSTAPPGSEHALLVALQGAAGTPLAALLPDEATARGLVAKLEAAALRVAEIDERLAQPAFDEAAAAARRADFEARGDSFGAATAASRMQNIRRLRVLRDEHARRIEQIEELFEQLGVQAEVLRFSGAAEDGTTDLVAELLCRLEGLDAVLDQSPGGGYE